MASISIPYLYEFDLAALCVLMVLMFLYATRQTFMNSSSKIFLIIIGFVFLATTTDLFSCFAISLPNLVPLWMNELLIILYLASYNSTPFLLLLYLLIFTSNNREQERLKKTIFFAVSSLTFAIATSPLTGFIFYFDDNQQYYHGPGFLIMYIIAAATLCYDVWILVKYRKGMDRHQYAGIATFLCICIFSAIVQVLVPKLTIANFAISLFLVVIYFTMQTPDFYVNKTSGCLNATAFVEHISMLIKDYKDFTAVAFTMDDFPYIKQILGKAGENRFLRDLGDWLQVNFSSNTVYALRDGRFVLMTDKRHPDEESIIQKVRTYFSEPICYDGVEMSLTPYFVVFSFPNSVITNENFLDILDYTLMEQTIERSRTVVHASEKLFAKRQREAKIVHAIKRALDTNSFEMHYQPIFDLNTGRFTALEALIRMHDFELGTIGPSEFIPIAEQNGMIIDISTQAFEKVCRFAQHSHLERFGISSIEYNLSIIEFRQTNLATKLLKMIYDHKLDPRFITFELTESMEALNNDSMKHNMEILTQAGCKFAMDDYGTGYSTTANLVNIPLHIIKVDKSILWSAVATPEGQTVLNYLVSTIKKLGKTVIVEGVENVQMVQMLRELKCDLLQGFYYSKPLCETDFLTFIQEQATPSEKQSEQMVLPA